MEKQVMDEQEASILRREQAVLTAEFSKFKLSYCHKIISQAQLPHYLDSLSYLFDLGNGFMINFYEKLAFVERAAHADRLSEIFKDLLGKFRAVVHKSGQSPPVKEAKTLCDTCGRQIRQRELENVKSSLWDEKDMFLALMKYEKLKYELEEDTPIFSPEENRKYAENLRSALENKQQILNSQVEKLSGVLNSMGSEMEGIAAHFKQSIQENRDKYSQVTKQKEKSEDIVKMLTGELESGFKGKVPPWISKMFNLFFSKMRRSVQNEQLLSTICSEKVSIEVQTEKVNSMRLRCAGDALSGFKSADVYLEERNLEAVEQESIPLSPKRYERIIEYQKSEIEKLKRELQMKRISEARANESIQRIVCEQLRDLTDHKTNSRDLKQKKKRGGKISYRYSQNESLEDKKEKLPLNLPSIFKPHEENTPPRADHFERKMQEVREGRDSLPAQAAMSLHVSRNTQQGEKIQHRNSFRPGSKSKMKKNIETQSAKTQSAKTQSAKNKNLEQLQEFQKNIQEYNKVTKDKIKEKIDRSSVNFSMRGADLIKKQLRSVVHLNDQSGRVQDVQQLRKDVETQTQIVGTFKCCNQGINLSLDMISSSLVMRKLMDRCLVTKRGDAQVGDALAADKSRLIQGQSKQLAGSSWILFIDERTASKYEESFTNNYHKRQSIVPSVEQEKELQSFFFIFEIIREKDPSVYQQLCSFIRFPYMTLKNDFCEIDVVKQMDLKAFMRFFLRILWFHRKCPLKGPFCEHVTQFTHQIVGIVAGYAYVRS